jgi:hypothetical protein
VSGVATNERRVHVTEQGLKRFFPKPIDWDELVGYLDGIIGEKNMQRSTSRSDSN